MNLMILGGGGNPSKRKETIKKRRYASTLFVNIAATLSQSPVLDAELAESALDALDEVD